MKNISRPQAYRIRRILELIRAGTLNQELPSARVLAQVLEVSWNTIIRDLDVLRDDEGAPIVYDASLKGFYLENPGWLLKPVTLHQREVFAFSVASRMLQPFRGTPLEMDLQSLFGKISRSLSGEVTMSAEALTEQVSMIGEDYVPQNRDVWITLAGHINRREVIQVRYQNFSGAIKTYRLAPVHLAAYHGNWYVLAFGPGKPKPATFALSRIRSLRRLTEAGWAPPDFDAGRYLGDAFGIIQGDQERTVHLRISKSIATYMGERVWHPSQKIKRRKNGDLDMAFTTRGWKELIRWILSWQPDVEVIAPAELRERVREKLEAGLKCYKQS